MERLRYGAAVGLRYGAALGLRYGAAVGRLCEVAVWGLSYGAAVILGSPIFPRAHVLLVALLVGLRCGAAPQSATASPHNLLEDRVLRAPCRWTWLLLGSLLCASLPLVLPASARRGALLRAAARCAVASGLATSAAPPLFAAVRSAAGIRPSPRAFALVQCGLALGEELAPLGRLLHFRAPAGKGGGALPAGAAPKMAAARDGWARGLWEALRPAGVMAARWGAGGVKAAAGAGGRAVKAAGVAVWRRMWGRAAGEGGAKMAAAAPKMAAAAPKMAGAAEFTAGATPKMASFPGTATQRTGSAPTASTPHFLLFLLNTALLIVLHGALAATATPGDGLGEGLGAGLGWAGHALTYGLWYRCPYSPGRPHVTLRGF